MAAAMLVPSVPAAAWSHKPSLVTGSVSTVTIRYLPGVLKRDRGLCRQSASCRAELDAELALAKLPPSIYGAWEARHLLARLNHLKMVGPGAYPCPLDLGNGYVARFTGPAGKVTKVSVAQSGCQWATVVNRRSAARWSTPSLAGRLHHLLVHGRLHVEANGR
jgi:hypothetical protein